MTAFRKHIYLYGPPASGKSSVGKALADNLNLPFWDLDSQIERQAGLSIPEIFSQLGEAGFRSKENELLAKLVETEPAVIALGGGALLDSANRSIADESGYVVCLNASSSILEGRLEADGNIRPLLAGGSDRLHNLLEERAGHYAAFSVQQDTSNCDIVQTASQIQDRLGRFFVRGMGVGYDVLVSEGIIDQVGDWLHARNHHGPCAVICDQNVQPLYADKIKESLDRTSFSSTIFALPAGEHTKEINTVASLWDGFIRASLERQSTLIACGGGVISDLAGFTAATYLRGIHWVVLPTSLLAMVDASLGGKTGIDLPGGKNLAGAFYPPRMVLVDPNMLESLPEGEISCGMAEVVKAGVIADPTLFELCALGWHASIEPRSELIRRAMAVKIHVIEADPFETGLRAVLNFGHTIAHAIERVTQFRIKHGQAVAIGMVLETYLAEQIGMADRGLAQRISQTLHSLHLPVSLPEGTELSMLIQAMKVDKKRKDGSFRFSLPCSIGDVRPDIKIEEDQLWQLFSYYTVRT